MHGHIAEMNQANSGESQTVRVEQTFFSNIGFEKNNIKSTDYFLPESPFVLFCLLYDGASLMRLESGIRNSFHNLTCAQADAHKSKVKTSKSTSNQVLAGVI